MSNETNNKDLLQDVAVEERVKMLAEMATKQQSEKVRRFYSDDEKGQIREALANDGITLMDKEEAFSEIKKEFNTAIKEFKGQVKSALKDLKKGFSENEENVFMIADQDNGMMDVYDSKGVHLYARKLFPDERQVTIMTMKTGTND